MMKAKNLMVVGIMLLASAPLFAQQITGSIRGTVTDSTGAVVAGATVTARQVETGLARTATTDRR
jgi:type 1 fimbria pilin